MRARIARTARIGIDADQKAWVRATGAVHAIVPTTTRAGNSRRQGRVALSGSGAFPCPPGSTLCLHGVPFGWSRVAPFAERRPNAPDPFPVHFVPARCGGVAIAHLPRAASGRHRELLQRLVGTVVEPVNQTPTSTGGGTIWGRHPRPLGHSRASGLSPSVSTLTSGARSSDLHQVITDYSRDVPPTAMSLDGPGARRCESNIVPLIVPRGLPNHRFVRYVRPPVSSPGRESVPLYPLQPATRQIRVLVDTGTLEQSSVEALVALLTRSEIESCLVVQNDDDSPSDWMNALGIDRWYRFHFTTVDEAPRR